MNIDELRKIKDNAPEDATHVTCGMYYWKWKSQSGWRTWCDVLVMWTLHKSPTASTQALADITTIIEQADRIAELEANQKRLMTAIICYDDCDSAGQYMRAQATMLKVVAEIEKAEGV
jgi:hypothetical protein